MPYVEDWFLVKMFQQVAIYKIFACLYCTSSCVAYLLFLGSLVVTNVIGDALKGDREIFRKRTSLKIECNSQPL